MTLKSGIGRFRGTILQYMLWILCEKSIRSGLCRQEPDGSWSQSNKVSLMTDGVGTPIEMAFHPANKHDCKTLHHILHRSARRHKLVGRGTRHADKGYDSRRCRDLVESYGLRPCIGRRGQHVDRVSNAVRVVLEQAFGLFDKYRRLLMRFDAKIVNFKSFHFLAATLFVSRQIRWLC